MTEPAPEPPRAASSEASDADIRWLRHVINLSRRCPPSTTAFSVGAVVLDAKGNVLADGYSRRDDPREHAEEGALRALDPTDPRLPQATLYTSLEPCSARSARRRSCSELIRDTSMGRVVFAWREPAIFVDCEGAEQLRGAGRTVIEVPELASRVREVNAHLL